MGFIWKTTQGKSILEYDGKTILTIPAAEGAEDTFEPLEEGA